MKKFKAIVAMSQNRVIGKDNTMPWHIPEDFRWFKSITLNHILVMGRKTFESLPGVLPKRELFVLTRQDIEIPGAQVIHDLSVLDDLETDKTIWISGGEEIYKMTLAQCSDLYVTHVKMDIEGDTFFPEFSHLFDEQEVVQDNEQFKIVHYVARLQDKK